MMEFEGNVGDQSKVFNEVRSAECDGGGKVGADFDGLWAVGQDVLYPAAGR